jgi:Fe-S cluster biosynthesis and repair protein YggX
MRLPTTFYSHLASVDGRRRNQQIHTETSLNGLTAAPFAILGLMSSIGTPGRTVFCVKFQREMPGLDEPPFDNHPLGQRIYENVSKEAWKMWLEQMKMIMNEYRLNLGTQEAQEFLLKQMEDYFFGQGAALPPGYVPPQTKN